MSNFQKRPQRISINDLDHDTYKMDIDEFTEHSEYFKNSCTWTSLCLLLKSFQWEILPELVQIILQYCENYCSICERITFPDDKPRWLWICSKSECQKTLCYLCVNVHCTSHVPGDSFAVSFPTSRQRSKQMAVFRNEDGWLWHFYEIDDI